MDSAEPLRLAVEAVSELIRNQNDDGLLIGGIAVAVVATPRATADVDALIWSPQDVPGVLASAESLGLEPRIGDALSFAVQHRVLLLRHATSGVNVDLSFGLLPFERETIDRATQALFEGIEVRVPTPEDLLIMKAVAGRGRDMGDIEAIAAVHPNIDKARIKYWLDQFGDVLETPDLTARTLERIRGSTT